MSKIVSNIIFLLSEKVLTTFILAISNVFVIRYLGVNKFGHLAIFQLYYALAVVASEFGIRRVYTSFRNNHREKIVFNEALRLKILAATIMGCIVILFIWYFNENSIYYYLVFAFIASPLETYSYHFEANLRNPLLSKIRISVSLLLALIRIVLCLSGSELEMFVLSFAVNNLLINIICFCYIKYEGFYYHSSMRASHRRIVRTHLLRRSLFFWLSVAIVQMNLRTDQFMLSMMAGTISVGIYAGAYKLVEQFMMIPSVLAGVFLPHVSKMENVDRGMYLHRLYFLSLVFSVPVSFFCACIAPFILPVLLGRGFLPSVPVFQVLVISLPILVLVNLSGLYYSIYKLEKYAFIRNLAGLFISLVMNYILIKFWGGVGAAISVFVSYFFVAFIMEFLVPVTRSNAIMKYRAVQSLFSLKEYNLVINYVWNIFEKR